MTFIQNGGGGPHTRCTAPDAENSAVFQIPFLPVVKRQRHSHGHETRWRQNQHENTFADRLCPSLEAAVAVLKHIAQPWLNAGAAQPDESNNASITTRSF